MRTRSPRSDHHTMPASKEATFIILIYGMRSVAGAHLGNHRFHRFHRFLEITPTSLSKDTGISGLLDSGGARATDAGRGAAGLGRFARMGMRVGPRDLPCGGLRRRS